MITDYDDDSWFDQDFRDNDDVTYNGRGESFVEHEAVTGDVTSQRREKERLFEEEIEQKWEKGGSGLVYYTGEKISIYDRVVYILISDTLNNSGK